LGEAAGADLIFDYDSRGGALQEKTHRYPLTNARATERTVLRSGTLHTVASATPAFGDGLSVEPAATNLLTYSEQFDNGAWQPGSYRATVTANAIAAPDGETAADLILETTANGSHQVKHLVAMADNTNYAYSVFVKAQLRTWVTLDVLRKDGSFKGQYFNLGAGVAGVAGNADTQIDNMGGGWYRCTIFFDSLAGATATAVYVGTATGDGGNSFVGDVTKGLYLWGAQLEAGTVPTAYIPTVASPVSRAADANLFTTPQAVKNLLSTEQPAPTSLDSEASGDIVLSTVAGTAFVMPDDGSSADLSPHVGRVLKVVDSAGKVAWGWLKAAGTGETLGSEILSNPSFDSDTSGWSAANSAALASVAGGQSGNCLEITENGGADPAAYQLVSFNTGALYLQSAYVKRGTESSYRMYCISGLTSGEATGEWELVNLYKTGSGGSANFVVKQIASSGAGTTLLFDEVSFKQVTAPPATGCTIVSTPGGTTQNWAYIQSGFNPNSISTWDVYAASQWRAQGTLVVRGWVPGYSMDPVNISGNSQSIISVQDNANSILCHQIAANHGYLVSATGGTAVVNPFDWASNTSYDLAVRWSSATNLMQVGYKLSSASTWTWGSTAAFDGAFTLGTSLNIGYSPSYPFEVGRVQFFNSWLSEAQLAWMDSLTEWVACADDYIYGRVAGM